MRRHGLSNCIIIALLGLNLPGHSRLMTLALFQGHRCVRNINCKYCLLHIHFLSSFNVVCLLNTLKKIMQSVVCVTPVCI